MQLSIYKDLLVKKIKLFSSPNSVYEIQEKGLDKLIKAGYSTLNYITYFTTGEMETRAWTIIKGDKAPVAAGKIHTDFEKGFIRAEVCPWEAVIEHGWGGYRERGY